MSRGLLYKILRNPIYVGKIAHKGQVYEGQHEGIVDPEIWQRVQETLANQSAKQRGVANQGESGHALKGKLFDGDGNYCSPTYTIKNGKHYNYYLNQTVLQFKDKAAGIVSRFPAYEFEGRVEAEIRKKLSTPYDVANILGVESDRYYEGLCLVSERCSEIPRENLLELVHKIIIGREALDITLSVFKLRNALEKVMGVWFPHVPDDHFAMITAQFEINRARGGAILIQPEGTPRGVLGLPPERLRRLILGIVWRDEHFRGKTIRAISQSSKYSEAQVRKLIMASLDIKSYSL